MLASSMTVAIVLTLVNGICPGQNYGVYYLGVCLILTSLASLIIPSQDVDPGSQTTFTYGDENGPTILGAYKLFLYQRL